MKIEKMINEDLTAVAKLAEQLGYPNKLDDFKSRFQTIQSFLNTKLNLFLH